MSDNGNRYGSISCKAIKGLLIFLEKNYGTEALTQYLGKLGLSYAYLSDSDNWISWDVYLKMIDELVLYTGTPASLFKAGEYSLGPDIWENVWYLVFTNLLTIKTMFKNGVLQNPKFNQAADWEILELTKNRLKLKIKWKDGIKTTRNSCLHRHGLIVRVPTVAGMPPAQFRELQCQTDGHDCCIEEYTWQNKPLRLFCLMLPVMFIPIYLIAGQFDIVTAGMPDTSVFALITFLLGYTIDDSKILKAVSRINYEQNRQLEKSFAKLEDKYDELKRSDTALEEEKERLRNTLEAITHPFYVIDADDYTVKMANSAAKFTELTGNSTCYALTHKMSQPCNSPEHPCPVEEIKRTRKPVIVEHIHHDKDGNTGFFEIHGYPIFDSDGNVNRIIEYSVDITARKHAEEKLQKAIVKAEEEKAKLDAIISGIGDGISIQDTEYKIIYQNDVQKNFIGDHVGEYCYKAYEQNDKVCKGCPLLLAFSDGKIHTQERQVFIGKDNKFFETTASPIKDAAGKIMAGVEVVRDITGRRRSEDKIKASLIEKEVLLKEVHHRVKNNMQVIIGLLNLQSRQVDDKRYFDMFNESRYRIMAMALVHEKLYQSKDLAKIDFQDYIKSLANNLMTSYTGRKAISLKLDAADVQLNIDIAIPCGLIINELISNSLKHAFPADREGEVNISFKKNADNGYELTVSDNGAGIPGNIMIRETRTLGLQLVTNLVEHQLQGELVLDRTGGTEFCIRFNELKYNKRI